MIGIDSVPRPAHGLGSKYLEGFTASRRGTAERVRYEFLQDFFVDFIPGIMVVIGSGTGDAAVFCGEIAHREGNGYSIRHPEGLGGVNSLVSFFF
jgi:hypothetical protein